jgi:hypothetical protein
MRIVFEISVLGKGDGKMDPSYAAKAMRLAGSRVFSPAWSHRIFSEETFLFDKNGDLCSDEELARLSISVKTEGE